jgi:hypothetical protein
MLRIAKEYEQLAKRAEERAKRLPLTPTGLFF